MRMKKMLAVALAFAVSLGGITFVGSNTKNVEAAEWNLVWSDEFDGNDLDTKTWTYEIGNGNWGWGNGEKQYYTNRTENVEVSNGTLKIKALKEKIGGQDYTSGRIKTQGKKAFKYGRVEARMKLPKFTGSWPAFWMLGASGGWPKCGEIDIMEAINTENFTHGALHWYVESPDYNGQGDAGGDAAGKTPAGYQRTDWHTYGIEWNEKQIKWYIDDEVFFTQNISASHMSEFRKNQYIILNLAIGGQWPGWTIDDSAFPNNSVMEVDYVKVYQKQEEPTITVTHDAVNEYAGTWTQFFGKDNGWIPASGTIVPGSTPSEGFTADITSVGNLAGDSVWAAQAKLEKLNYYPGNTYKYKCTITSDKDKTIFVKVADVNEEAMGGGWINLKADVPYNFETDVEIPEDYTDTISLKFGMGKTEGDSIENNGAVKINVKDISFVTTATIPDPNYKPNETTTKNEVTTKDAVSSTAAAKVVKTKVTKATKKKASKSAKISLKTVKGAKGYKVQISTSKKFKKSKKVKVVTKYVKKAKFTFKSSKIKNKKKLYVRARAYKIVKGKKKYGKWSNPKKITIKK